MLFPTPRDRLCDSLGRPYFLWDCDLTLDAWRALTRDADPDVRAYWIGVAMRQAKPDDVLTLLTWPELEEAWPRLRLGRETAFWEWLRARVRHAA
ncbi:MAG: hypothetical protein RLZZ299_1370 [Pseudomonadota bacterium]|jgi:hypothetical protein